MITSQTTTAGPTTGGFVLCVALLLSIKHHQLTDCCHLCGTLHSKVHTHLVLQPTGIPVTDIQCSKNEWRTVIHSEVKKSFLTRCCDLNQWMRIHSLDSWADPLIIDVEKLMSMSTLHAVCFSGCTAAALKPPFWVGTTQEVKLVITSVWKAALNSSPVDLHCCRQGGV